ncbi:hypothetical protein [Magnetospirillum moscoviense]|uniref:Uncharacterized protein n=1 Tax=Magnetospirillum moscoviense TaxID=1437059 RepID=A0A178MPH5_9PROT|nr:hypothetical protein [Magnetospirillum moscoviense]OAN50700.1 hypothetical protein A6A05_11890 [Magnetospirillum moscoviense]
MNLTTILGDVAAIAANPVLGLAKVAIDLAPDIADLFGDDDAAKTVEKIATTVKALTGTDDPAAARETLSDPVLLAQLRSQAQAFAHAETMARMNNTLAAFQATLGDRQGARARDMEITKAGRTNHRANVLLVVAMIGVVACICAMIFGQIDGNTALGGTILSIAVMLANKFVTAFDFEFGGSADSAETRNLLAKAPPIA